MQKILFFSEEINFNLKNKIKIRDWLRNITLKHGAKIKVINYIFCSDEYLKEVNKEYLGHDYFTDIVTFDNSDKEDFLEGDIFISIDRVKENSSDFSKSFEDELHRVMIHGILHLLGFSDKEDDDVKEMRNQENQSLQALKL